MVARKLCDGSIMWLLSFTNLSGGIEVGGQMAIDRA
jgi:hypothetical protein